MPTPDLTIIIPARDEAGAIQPVLACIRSVCPAAELLVVDDGSTDDTARIARDEGATVICHPYPMGNGAAIKTGARNARGNTLVFLDADGQHDPTCIPRLLEPLKAGYMMAVGARSADSHANFSRKLANRFYNALAGWMTGQHIEDLTSGFRAVRADAFRSYLYLLPNGFSYPTTITMAFFRSGLPVCYVPIQAGNRKGRNSHIRVLQDGTKFLLIIFKIGTLYSPLRLFGPISLMFLLTGLSYYAFTYITQHRFTNMGMLMLATSVIVFLIGLISEQITNLLYSDHLS